MAIQFAKGYRPDIKAGVIQGNGLLSVTSYPKAARVYLNDKLTTVTDDKLYLLPNTYNIKIEKDGFHPWTKTIPVKPELVSSADARLFPIISATAPLSFYHVKLAQTNPEGNKIVYFLDNTPENAESGLFVYSPTNNQFLSSQTLQIADKSKDWTKALLIWSPDSAQILAIFTETVKKTERITSSYLLSTRALNNSKTLPDITYRLPTIIQDWQDKYTKINQPVLALYPKSISDILTTQATNVYFSPDKEKVVYSPTENISLQENEIAKALPNINSTPENRELQKDQTYIFDLKEGTNYHLPQVIKSATAAKQIISDISESTSSSTLSNLRQLRYQADSLSTTNFVWYGSSRLLILSSQDGVKVIDYDGVNITPITSAQIIANFAAPATDGSRLILLTNINQKPDIFNLIQFDLH